MPTLTVDSLLRTAVDFAVPESASALADDESSYPQQVLLRYTSQHSRHRNDMIIYMGCGRKVNTGAGNDGERVYFLRPTINLAASAGSITLDPSSKSGLRIDLGMLVSRHDIAAIWVAFFSR